MLRILREHIEVTVLIEDAGVLQLVFGIEARAATSLFDQFLVREAPCGYL